MIVRPQQDAAGRRQRQRHLAALGHGAEGGKLGSIGGVIGLVRAGQVRHDEIGSRRQGLVAQAGPFGGFHAQPVHAAVQLDREGLDGQYGYYESIDYTPAHVPPGRRSVVVKAFMAHHQGMSLVALCNLLCNWPMQRRFFSDARVKASALLLEERVPTAAPLITPRAEQVPTLLLGEPELRLTDHVGPGQRAVQRLHLLGHGELSTIISASGGGVITWKGMNVTRYREDAALDDWAEKIRSQPWSEADIYFKHEDEATGPRLAARFLERLG